MGGNMDDVISITTYVPGMDGLRDIHRVRQEYFSEPYPASTLVQIAGFVDPDILIEVTAVAEIPSKRFNRPEEHADPYFSESAGGFSL
jgi:enamine deaminase RidA (YjgF/YER057c/UK114 family)